METENKIKFDVRKDMKVSNFVILLLFLFLVLNL